MQRLKEENMNKIIRNVHGKSTSMSINRLPILLYR